MSQIKLTFDQANRVSQAIEKIMQAPINDFTLPIVQLKARIEAESVSFFKTIDKARTDMGEPIVDENGNPTGGHKVKPENMQKFTKLVDGLYEKEITVEKSTSFPTAEQLIEMGKDEKFSLFITQDVILKLLPVL